ncbi:sulfatase family protein [Coraliomargarita parva]|uniref:sulfatase family protein n=1 Tax=Coraliomargarita parva TaxID=3014050 RepID=UPI0022B4EDC2|nr:sulfatase-like hydrolase/transferase [Coraliomargarita parva]
MSQPNLLIICCDQLSAQALGPWGNTYAKTPNLGRLAARSLKFRQAYTNCPLCLPSRASFWSGRYPHQTGILANGVCFENGTLDPARPTLGTLFHDAGYETVHFGKQHDGGALRGFELSPIQRADRESLSLDSRFMYNHDTLEDAHTTEKAVEFLNHHSGSTPYLAAVDLNNPHNICQWIGENSYDRPLSASFEDLPDLPENLYIDDEEMAKRPRPIQYLPYVHKRQAQMGGWDEAKIRHYLHAYHYYLSLADAQIGRILAALEAREDASNTMVLFFADHGDSMCGRWMGTKHTSFYEETMHVPMMFSGPGIKQGDHWAEGLCSLIDLLPTLCEYANLPAPAGLPGTSLVPQLRGEASDTKRDAVFAQWHTEFGYTIEPGRMVRTECYKYTRYIEGDGEEFYDLVADPGETRNLAFDPDYAEELDAHRQRLGAYCQSEGDPFFTLEYKVDPQFREGEPDYRSFSGTIAADLYEPKG